MIDAHVMRVADGLAAMNSFVLVPVWLRFQIAPGKANGLGIAGLDYTINFRGTQIATGTTNADGEVPIYGLSMGPVTLRILDTEYEVSLNARGLLAIETLQGQQQRLDQLGYVTGVLLKPIESASADDGVDGPRTQQAILNFQMDNGLTVEGDVGPQTIGKLRSEAGQ